MDENRLRSTPGLPVTDQERVAPSPRLQDLFFMKLDENRQARCDADPTETTKMSSDLAALGQHRHRFRTISGPGSRINATITAILCRSPGLAGSRDGLLAQRDAQS